MAAVEHGDACIHLDKFTATSRRSTPVHGGHRESSSDPNAAAVGRVEEPLNHMMTFTTANRLSWQLIRFRIKVHRQGKAFNHASRRHWEGGGGRRSRGG